MSEKPQFTYENLYSGTGATERPKASDIRQDAIGDCYFVAVAGAMAQGQPDRIKDAIKFNDDKDTFTVTMYKDVGGKAQQVKIEVTQAEIADNIKRQGGSLLDNNGQKTPVWPAVMETAYAKMNDSNHKDGLGQGYNKIDQGGWARDAMFALTGTKGVDLSRSEANNIGEAKVFERINNAMTSGRAVTLSTDPESGKKQDGLIDNHVYMVTRVYKDKNGDMMVDLRNPWATNTPVGEGKDSTSPTVTVKFKDVLNSGGFEEFNVGPAMKTQGKNKSADKEEAVGGKNLADAVPQASDATGQRNNDKQASTQTGDKYVDALVASIGNPALMRESLGNLAANTPSFRQEGQAQLQQTEAPTRPPVTATPQPEPINEERAGRAR
jgi:Calpain family cysteine protease